MTPLTGIRFNHTRFTRESAWLAGRTVAGQ